MNTQIGESLMGDFEDNTWTFEMPEDFILSAGIFAIVPIDKFKALKKDSEDLSKISR